LREIFSFFRAAAKAQNIFSDSLNASAICGASFFIYIRETPANFLVFHVARMKQFYYYICAVGSKPKTINKGEINYEHRNREIN
jgi:hypothetical protein